MKNKNNVEKYYKDKKYRTYRIIAAIGFFVWCFAASISGILGYMFIVNILGIAGFLSIGLLFTIKPDNFLLPWFYVGAPTKIRLNPFRVRLYESAVETVGPNRALIFARIFGIVFLTVSIIRIYQWISNGKLF